MYDRLDEQDNWLRDTEKILEGCKVCKTLIAGMIIKGRVNEK